MCDPISATVGISAAGSLAKGISGYQTARANAAALDTAAAQREEKAKYDIEQSDVKFRRQQGSVVAEIGKSGLDRASFSDVLADDAKESALEKLTIKQGGEVDAQGLRYQASGQRRAAVMSLITGGVGVGTSVAGGYADQAKLDRIRAGVNVKNDFE